jgi:hypothetical protein
VRKVIPAYKERMLTSFKPLFGDWDYLPLVINDWLAPSADKLTWVVESGSMLVAMGQAAELEEGDWYLNGLRSNPQATPLEIGVAILAMKRVIQRELEAKDAKTLRYGTLPWFAESLRMGALFGFREHFRLGHAHHSLPGIPDAIEGILVRSSDNLDELLNYFEHNEHNPVLKSTEGYFFTWWDTRKLRKMHLVDASRQGLLLEASADNQVVGAAMFYHVPWQKFLVLSLMDGTDEALKALYRQGISTAYKLRCMAIGMVHPSFEEMKRRQQIFGLEEQGCETVQLIYRRQ